MDCFRMDNYLLHVQESVNLTIYLYAQTMGQRIMLYIRKFTYLKHIYNTGIAASMTCALHQTIFYLDTNEKIE